MKLTLDVGALQVGMFVRLPGFWLNHSFLRSKFKLVSEEQIAEIRR